MLALFSTTLEDYIGRVAKRQHHGNSAEFFRLAGSPSWIEGFGTQTQVGRRGWIGPCSGLLTTQPDEHRPTYNSNVDNFSLIFDSPWLSTADSLHT